MNRYGQKYGLVKQQNPTAHLSGRVTFTRLSLALESALQNFWPLFTLLAFTYTFIAFNGLNLFPILVGQIGLGLVGLAALYFLFTGFRGFRIPSRQAAMGRMDAALPERPIAALQDESALGKQDPLTREIWHLHQQEMATLSNAARVAPPEPNLPRRDRAGLRLMAVIAGIVAITFAPKAELARIVDAVTGAENIIAPSVAIEAWATPPGYTGKPALYLSEIDNNTLLELPVNTIITMRTYGIGAFELAESVSGENTVLAPVADGVTVRDISFNVVQSGGLGLRDGEDILGDWRVTVIPDLPPSLSVPEGIEKSAEGFMELTYLATDDYGIAQASITITPDLSLVDRRFGLIPDPEMPAPITRDLPLPFSNDRTNVKELFSDDYSTHMWAGLPVIVTLSVTDAAGQTTMLALDPDALPGRSFFDPLAGAIIEQRRDLMWSPENDDRVSQVMRAITYQPEDDLFPNASSYLLTRSAIRRMGYAMENGIDKEMRTELADMFWLIAELIENGDLSSAEARLRRAQDRVAQGLENGATPEEMQELMDELRDATDDYLQELAENAEPGDQQAQGEQQTITSDQLQEMLDKLQELSENGQTEEAQQLLEQLREFMENMEVTQSEGQSGRQSRDQQDLQNSLEQQQELSDEAFQQLQEQFEQQLGEQGEQGEEQQGGSSQELADQQEALRDFIDQLREQQGDGGGEGEDEALDRAEESMGNARDRLEEGDLSGALDEQAQAMEELRQGLRDLQNQNQADQSGQDGQVDPESAQRDPLGRPIGSQGRVDNGDTAVPDQSDSDRARELMEEIRRRSGEQERPSDELEYLKRLLERF